MQKFQVDNVALPDLLHILAACSLEIINQIRQSFSNVFSHKNQLDFSPGEQPLVT
jgi:hypothetical protein